MSSSIVSTVIVLHRPSFHSKATHLPPIVHSSSHRAAHSYAWSTLDLDPLVIVVESMQHADGSGVYPTLAESN